MHWTGPNDRCTCAYTDRIFFARHLDQSAQLLTRRHEDKLCLMLESWNEFSVRIFTTLECGMAMHSVACISLSVCLSVCLLCSNFWNHWPRNGDTSSEYSDQVHKGHLVKVKVTGAKKRVCVSCLRLVGIWLKGNVVIILIWSIFSFHIFWKWHDWGTQHRRPARRYFQTLLPFFSCVVLPVK